MTPERFQKITKILSQRQADLTLVLDAVHKGRNLAAIIRSADAHGIDKIHCVIPERGFQHYRGTALGSHKWVSVSQYSSVNTPLVNLKDKGYQLVATSLGEVVKDYRSINYTKPTAIIMGTENQGIGNDTLALVDQCITIPMVGMTDSLNVSVACAIVMAEAQRQRQLAGMYQSRQLPPALFKKRLFQWCYPDLAQFCDQQGYTYPDIDEQNGAILNGPGWYKDKKNQASGGDRLDKTIRSKL